MRMIRNGIPAQGPGKPLLIAKRVCYTRQGTVGILYIVLVY
jgi:hypothetical protein